MQSVLNFESVTYLRQGQTIIDDFHWQMHPRQHWVMLGPNGAGKSTLVALMCARVWPTRGLISVLGQPLKGNDVQALRQSLGIFQPALQAGLPAYHPSMTAAEVVLTGLDGSLAVYREYSKQEREKVQALYASLFPTEHASYPLDRPFRLLSSGEQSRVLLMRCFIQLPEMVLLDEPYESLDIPARLALEKALSTYLESHGTPSLTILHRVEEIPTFATHIILVKKGKLFQAGPIAAVLKSAVLSALYDVDLRVSKESSRYYCVPID